MGHGVECLFKISSGASPTAAIGDPHKLNAPYLTGFFRDHFVASCGFIYARVSTDSDEQFTSYEAQIDYYTQYIKKRDDWEFVKVYTDEGISGTNTKRREGFNEMVADALAGKIEIKTAELIQFDFSGAAKF